MIELSIVPNEMMSSQENLYHSACFSNLHYAVNRDSITLFSPKNDGHHQYQLKLEGHFFDKANRDFFQIIPETDILEVPDTGRQAEYQLPNTPSNQSSDHVFESGCPQIDLVPPSILGYYRFMVRKNDKFPTQMLMRLAQDYSIILFPFAPTQKWPVIIYRSEWVRPAIFTHPEPD